MSATVAITDSAGRTPAELAALLGSAKLPPVHLWNPTHCGPSHMRIAADGTWFHEGSPIGRKELVKLFSTILRREADGSFVLVTPVEKLDIQVDDAPFIAVEATSEGEGASRRLIFRLNTDDLVAAGPDNVLRVETAADGTPRPYLHVRSGLEALVNRAVFYQLADLALAEAATPALSGRAPTPALSGGAATPALSGRAATPPGLWSGGAFFPFMPA